MKKAIILLGLAVIGFTGCKKKNENLVQPISSFTLTTNECYVGDMVIGTNHSTNKYANEWSIDGEYFSNTTDFIYTPTQASYGDGLSITLKTVSSDGLSDYSTQKLKVKNFSEAFKGKYVSKASNECTDKDIEITVDEGSQFATLYFEGVELFFQVTSKTFNQSGSGYTSFSDGSYFLINSSTISLNGNELTLVINYKYYDSNYNLTTGTCTSKYIKIS